MNGFCEKDIEWMLDVYWEKIACIAYEGFFNMGRGFVSVERRKESIGLDLTASDLRMKFMVFNGGEDCGGTEDIINFYDPLREIILHYFDEKGLSVSQVLRTKQGRRSPLRVWFFEKIMMDLVSMPQRTRTFSFQETHSSS